MNLIRARIFEKSEYLNWLFCELRWNNNSSSAGWTGGVSSEPRIDTIRMKVVLARQSSDDIRHDEVVHANRAFVVLFCELVLS